MAGSITVRFEGTGILAAAIERLAARGEPAARDAAEAMAAVAEREIKKKLGTSSHRRGTPTPSAPGEPPSLITGQLRRSVRETKSAGGAGHWEARVAPTTVYARIQELGGDAGRGHRSHLPARPYVRPALAGSAKTMRAAAVRAFRRALETA